MVMKWFFFPFKLNLMSFTTYWSDLKPTNPETANLFFSKLAFMIRNKRWYILTFFVYFDSKTQFSDSGLEIWSDEQVCIQEFEFDLVWFYSSSIEIPSSHKAWLGWEPSLYYFSMFVDFFWPTQPLYQH